MIFGFLARIYGNQILKRDTFACLFEGEMLRETEFYGLRLIFSRQIVALHTTQVFTAYVGNITTQFQYQAHFCLESLTAQEVMLRRHEHFGPLAAVMQKNDQTFVLVGKLRILHQELAYLIALVHATCIEIGEAIYNDQICRMTDQTFFKF